MAGKIAFFSQSSEKDEAAAEQVFLSRLYNVHSRACVCGDICETLRRKPLQGDVQSSSHAEEALAANLGGDGADETFLGRIRR